MGLEDFKGMRCCYIHGQIVPVSNGVWNKNFKGELLKRQLPVSRTSFREHSFAETLDCVLLTVWLMLVFTSRFLCL